MSTRARKYLPSKKTKELLEVLQLASAGLPLSGQQASLYYQGSANTLAVWRSQGKGPRFVLIGTHVRYLKKDLDDWIASCQTRKRVSPNVGRPPKKAGRP